MGWPSKLTDRELKRDSLLMSCTSPKIRDIHLLDSRNTHPGRKEKNNHGKSN